MGGSGKFYLHTGPPTRDKCYLNINKKRSESEWYIISRSWEFDLALQAEGLKLWKRGIMKVLDQYQYLGNCPPTPC